MTLDPARRRAVQREPPSAALNVVVDVLLEGVSARGLCRSLSVTRMALRCPLQPLRGSLLTVVVALPGEGELSVPGVVGWTVGDTLVVELCPSPLQSAAIASYLDRIREIRIAAGLERRRD